MPRQHSAGSQLNDLTSPWSPTRTAAKFESSIATMKPTVRQRRLTLVLAAFVLIATGIIAPFGAVRLPKIDGFIPAIESAIIITDFFTAVLLFVQRTDRRTAHFNFSGCICAVWSSRCRTLNHSMDFCLLAFGIIRFSDWLCLPD